MRAGAIGHLRRGLKSCAIDKKLNSFNSPATHNIQVKYNMEVPLLAPETVTSLVEPTIQKLTAEQIDSTFKSDSIGRSFFTTQLHYSD